MEDDLLDMQFTASDATRANAEHYQKEQQAHNKHLNACKLRLRRFIREQPQQTFLVYQVPIIVIGSALREAKSVINHMIHSLRKDGFSAEYLGSNLLFISWKAARRENVVNDYVKHAELGFPGERRRTATHVIAPLTRENIQRRGPGPAIIMNDTERTKARLDREILKRMQRYEENNSHPYAQRRRHFDNMMSHEDAMRSAVTAVTRNTL